MGSSISSVGGGLDDSELGDNLTNSNNPEASIISPTFVKLKETRVFRGGQLRVKFSHWSGYATMSTACRVYINGVAVGVEHTTTSSTPTVRTDDVTVNEGDLVQVYGRWVAAAIDSYVKDFKLYELSPHDFVNELE